MSVWGAAWWEVERDGAAAVAMGHELGQYQKNIAKMTMMKRFVQNILLNSDKLCFVKAGC